VSPKLQAAAPGLPLDSDRLQRLLQLPARQVTAELLGLGAEFVRSVPATEQPAIQRAAIDQILALPVTDAPDLPIADGAHWRAFARHLLETDRAHGADVSLNNEETVHQLLGVLGKQPVFGIYHGCFVRLPRRMTVRLVQQHGWRYLPTLLQVGAAPLALELHLPKLRNKRLDEALNIESHLQMARLLTHNPAVRGVFNSNWFYDPALGAISPRLAFLSTFASSHGAYLVRIGPDPGAVADATSHSATRRRHFEAGDYMPTRYGRFWPREALLTWARAQGGAEARDLI
jgi:hypothetical protein